MVCSSDLSEVQAIRREGNNCWPICLGYCALNFPSGTRWQDPVRMESVAKDCREGLGPCELLAVAGAGSFATARCVLAGQ